MSSEPFEVWATPAPLARVVRPSAPGDAGGGEDAALSYAAWFLGLSESRSRIDHETALAYSAVWACVRLITQALAGVSWQVYERSADRRSRMPVENNEAWLLDLQPNPEMGAFSFREKLLKDALTWGNGFAEIERTGTGRARWLWPIDPARVKVVRGDMGELLYEVKQGPGLRPVYLAARDVFHVKGLGPDGVVGYSVIELARRSIELGLDTENYGLQAFSNGPLPGGFLRVPQKLSPEQHREMRRSFEEAYVGKSQGRRVVVLHGGVEFLPGMLPNDDAQFLESRRFQVGDICRWFGVPPHKVGDLERATFSNIEEQEIAFARDCLAAWARRLEAEANIKLYGPIQTGRRYTRLDLEPLTRGNALSQAQTVSGKVTSGLLTVNEGRAYFGLDPVEGGDTALIQGAMARLEDIVSPPEPAPPPAPPGDEGDEEEGDEGEGEGGEGEGGEGEEEGAEARWLPLLEATYRRLLRVEMDKAQRAEKAGRLAAWAEEYYGRPEATEHVIRELVPVFGAMAGRPRAPGLAAAAAQRHVAISKAVAGLSTLPEEDVWLSLRPGSQARRDLKEMFP